LGFSKLIADSADNSLAVVVPSSFIRRSPPELESGNLRPKINKALAAL
jgi:hypothetical protein